MKLDAYASRSNYLAHIVPIWRALDHEERGALYVHSQSAQSWARRHHVEFTAAIPRGRGNPVVIAGMQDCPPVRRDRKVALVEHGSGQRYIDSDNVSYSGGEGREEITLFLCPNDSVAKANQDRYPDARVAVIGSPRVQELRTISRQAKMPCISFHWEARSVSPEARWAWPHYAASMRSLAEQFPGMAGHAHPRVWQLLQAKYQRAGLEPVQDFEDVIARASVYVVDNSSTAIEAMACGIPVVLMNAPWYRRDIDHGGRFWRYAKAALTVDEPSWLPRAIQAALELDDLAGARAELVSEVYPVICGAADKAVQALREAFD